MLKSIFKPETREQLQEKRTNEILNALLIGYDSGFTSGTFSDLETVQILNSLRRKLSEHLETKKSEAMQRSVNENQKANEIKEAISYLE